MNHLTTQSTENLSELADAEYARRVVRILVASYPHGEPKDPEIYIEQLVGICAGKPKWVLKTMVNPEHGVMLESPTFLPTPGEVAKWLRAKIPQFYEPVPPEHRLSLPEPEFKITDEERARRLEVVKKLKRIFAETAEKMSPPKPKFMQRADTPENRAELLKTPLMQEGGND